MAWLRLINLAFAVWALLAPMAHLLELPNKLALHGPLWLAVQQHLYRGWGPILGGPSEVGSLVTSVWLAVLRRQSRPLLRPTVLACLCYVGMIVAFFTLNAPVNHVVAVWTPKTLPADWSAYRARWEAGHAIAAAFSVVGLAALIRAYVRARISTRSHRSSPQPLRRPPDRQRGYATHHARVRRIAAGSGPAAI